MNYFENELLEAIRQHHCGESITVVPESISAMRMVESGFPMGFSRIDWALVPDAVTADAELGAESANFTAFFERAISKNALTGRVIYFGDGCTDFSLITDVDNMLAVAPLIVACVPQHHFFIAADGVWCASLMMEGEMGFGFRSLDAS